MEFEKTNVLWHFYFVYAANIMAFDNAVVMSLLKISILNYVVLWDYLLGV